MYQVALCISGKLCSILLRLRAFAMKSKELLGANDESMNEFGINSRNNKYKKKLRECIAGPHSFPEHYDDSNSYRGCNNLKSFFQIQTCFHDSLLWVKITNLNELPLYYTLF